MSDGFLARWTRRKHAVRAAEQVPRTTEPGSGPEDAGLPPLDGSAETWEPRASDSAARSAENEVAATAEPLAELPSLDALSAESDLAPFLRTGVPAALRNAALRRMWSLDPSIRDFVSEAREYAYDWNTPGGVPGLGPLLPSDDVQAMLRRIVGGVSAERPPTGNPDPDTRDADARAADVREPEADDDSAGPPGSVEAETAEASVRSPKLTEAEPMVAVSPTRSPSLPDAVPRGAEPAERPATAAGLRLRRHGGAMPT